MGFLRRKKVKTHQYWYWCHRKRDRKKNGGTGAVRSIELYLGSNILYLEYAPFWIWRGEVNKSEYLQQLMNQLVKQSFGDLVGCDVEGDKIRFYSKPHIDLRLKRWRFDLYLLRHFRFDEALYQSSLFDREIEYARNIVKEMADLNRDISCVESMIEEERGRGDIQREESLQSVISSYEGGLSYCLTRIEFVISRLLKRTPTKYQKESRERLCKEIYSS